MAPQSLRNKLVAAALAAFVLLVVAWQTAEYRRVRRAQRDMLLTHARDIANSLAVVLRSQARFAAIQRRRLEAALQDLCRSRELLSLALISPTDETVTAAGDPLPPGSVALPPGTQRWERHTLTVVELLQLAPGRLDADSDETGGLLVVDHMPFRSRRGERDAKSRHGEGPPGDILPADPASRDHDGRRPPEAGSDRRPPDALNGGDRERGDEKHVDPEARSRFMRWLRKHGRRGARPRYPPWLSEEQFNHLFASYGLQRFIIVLSSRDVTEQIRRDLWLRGGFVAAALLAALALAFLWRNLGRSTELRFRLVRVQEMNTHLRELNTAAAGLAHETRNPLNSVRGLAHFIASDDQTSTASRKRAETVIAEVDRVNSRLGEFIAYSRPRVPAPSTVALRPLVDEVARAAEIDREESRARLDIALPDVCIYADNAQLRQVLFNLLLNAYQAVPPGGTVRIDAIEHSQTLTLRVSDNGPGVPREAREDIFRPYFTLSEKGSGLGLAVVRQIVLAHHWEICYDDNEAGGALFSIEGIKRG